MRILLTTDTIGGVWTFTKDLCEGLLSRGHEVVLVSVGRSRHPSQTAWCRKMLDLSGRRFRVESWDTPLEWMEKNDAAYSGAESALLRVAREFKADLIHANQFCFGALPVDLPKVVTAHSDVLSWAETCRPEGLPDSNWLRHYRSLVTSGLRGADAVVAPTRWMADALTRCWSAAGDVKVIRNGRTILGRPPAPDGRVLQAVSVGRWWDEAKGFHVLEGIDAAMPVVVAGETTLEGPGGAGALSEDEVLDLFMRSSVYAATSVYEPFGLAPLEAALCGCAVVANDIASLREVWGDAATYFSGTADLEQILESFVRSREELRCAQLRSLRRGLELSADSMVTGYVEVYAELGLGRLACSQSVRPLLREAAAYAG